MVNEPRLQVLIHPGKPLGQSWPGRSGKEAILVVSDLSQTDKTVQLLC